MNTELLFIDTDSPDICRLWAYRLIVNQKLIKKLYDIDELDTQLAIILGLSNEAELLSPMQLQRALIEKLRQLELQPAISLPATLAVNIQSLGAMIGLNTLEQQLLGFIALVKADQMLSSVCALLRNVKKTQLPALLAQTLGATEAAVKHMLRFDSTLLNSGLIAVESQPIFSLDDVFEFISFNFGYKLFEDNTDTQRLLKEIVQKTTPPSLTISQYQHLNTDLHILLPYLKKVVKQQLRGVNILIYGPPGTGKSELVRVVAQQLKIPLFEVSSEDDEGDGIAGHNRLRAYRMAQSFLANSAALLLFDETEDVFIQNPFARQAEPRKGWMNRMLEQNAVPCFWVTNDRSVIDDAFIRRFDQVIELNTPPKAQRAALLHSAAVNLLTPQEAAQLAEHPHLTPAIITRAGKVVAQLNPRLKRTTKVAALQHLMQQTLRAQGYRIKDELTHDVLGPVYNATWVNSDVDLNLLTEGLSNAGSGRLCLYGPPGTGKTAFCHYLAKQLQQPLLLKTASQLIGKFVGETEQNIAAAFAEAKQNEAILLLDEVDSFLQDRRKALHSWEVTSVNEMLMQMEAFNGIFVASTNLLHNLDQASLRRFDLKACFNYLKPEQAVSLFSAHCKQLKLQPCQHSVQKISGVRQLTPGDFAAIARQSRFRPFSTAGDFARALLQEVSLKSADTAKPIGFLQ
ncbi:hypothetical protein VT06_15285 [Arsukibacterium sp. MJ3]|nr:hypothetical protein VT06_15285 [Arsukibacterium sp. MJ3]